ncbi:MAG: diguanylate cyclase [Planctomycetaceae bacterium]|nr:diguanylate cyclase [Planctomycetaceae bacterium]
MMKLLIVDDSPDSLEVARIRLAKEGLDIYCADGGRAGLEIARREKPDLILLDVDMPEMSGFDVCRELKADPDLCMIPVLFVTASCTAEDKVRGLDLGAIDYVTKPFDSFELCARVRAALRTKHLQDLLVEYAHIDPLTGLPNRRALFERLEREWARIERHGGRLSFIMADIDRFKEVNDRFGHHIGDKMLHAVAQAIVKQCRELDLPARYGGEEFAVVVPFETAEDAARLAERCRQEIAAIALPCDGETVAVTASFGVAEATGLSSIALLVERADQALYEAKKNGRNIVQTCQNTASDTGKILDEDLTVMSGLADGGGMDFSPNSPNGAAS